ncbi:hypothetical protein ABT224_33585 [Streptomyces sp. NPDC001584]|uniref:hypothetical protein n=1 Tax=Streptomyces sp. NPDC001584 TaxID=3154521 RepID=UPI00331A985F
MELELATLQAGAFVLNLRATEGEDPPTLEEWGTHYRRRAPLLVRLSLSDPLRYEARARRNGTRRRDRKMASPAGQLTARIAVLYPPTPPRNGRTTMPDLPTIEVENYRSEAEQSRLTRDSDYHPATAQEPRRVRTNGTHVLSGTYNGSVLAGWRDRHLSPMHITVTGSGYAYGAVVAACDASRELSEEATLSDLVEAIRVDEERRCRRQACRTLFDKAIQAAAVGPDA